MAKDEEQTMLKRIRIISKELYIIGICLFAIILIYASYLYKYEMGALKDYFLALLNCFIVGILLSYALLNYICGKEKRMQMLLGLFAALFALMLGNVEYASDYWELVLFFWPLAATTCFLAVMAGKSKSRKHLQLSAIPLYLFIVAVGFCVYRGRSSNLFIFPFWLIYFSCAAISFSLAFRDIDKVRIRVLKVLLVFCFFLTWLIYDELRVGHKLDRLFQEILILIWPIVVYAFANISERVKGMGRLFIYYVMVFLGMLLLAEPYISRTGLKWEVVTTLYLLLTADVVIIAENHRQRQSGKKVHKYIMAALINAAYLIFIVWSSHRIRDILHSLLNENNWGSFRLEALKANISRNMDAPIWRQLNDWSPPLSEMNLNVGTLLPMIIITLTCFTLYFAGKSHCENETAELIKRYLCYAFLIRIVLSVVTNLFLFTSSRIDFPLLLGGEGDLAVMVMLFCISMKSTSYSISDMDIKTE